MLSRIAPVGAIAARQLVLRQSPLRGSDFPRVTTHGLAPVARGNGPSGAKYYFAFAIRGWYEQYGSSAM